MPSVTLNTRKVKYGWLHKWSGGSVESTLYPDNRVMVVDWLDEGTNGVWKTKAQIPLCEPKKTKISVSREWKY